MIEEHVDEHGMIPVLVDNRVVGHLPPFVAPEGCGVQRFRLRSRISGRSVLVVDLEISEQHSCGVPVNLYAKDFQGLLALPDFLPEDHYLVWLTAGDPRR